MEFSSRRTGLGAVALAACEGLLESRAASSTLEEGKNHVQAVR